eukprot:COSAG01_NODE_509_length_16084_cov_18.063180_15_plen_87_part_00
MPRLRGSQVEFFGAGCAGPHGGSAKNGMAEEAAVECVRGRLQNLTPTFRRLCEDVALAMDESMDEAMEESMESLLDKLRDRCVPVH